jgi:hypothetical protein
MPHHPILKHEASWVYGRAEERVNQALQQALTGVRQPPPVTDLFPPRHGYDRTPLTLMDIQSSVTRYAAPDYRYDYSGSRGTFTGTSRPGIGMV